MSKNLSELAGKKGVNKNLFEELGIASQESGTPSKEELKKLADEFLVGLSSTYGTASFYDFMKPENKGKKVYVCNGTACVCSGKQDEVKKSLSSHFKEDEIGHMTCLGRCHENAAFNYNGKNYSAKDNNDILNILKEAGNQNEDNYNVKALGKEILTSKFSTVDEYYKLLESSLKRDSQDILNEIKKSNIRGRGGAGFPMGFKFESCRNVESDQKFIICNADEGDPGAYSDRYLLEQQPHSVLFGMMMAGYTTGASWGLLYIRGEYPEAAEIVQNAINELRDKNLIGDNILGSGFDFNFKIIRAQGSYICGEETALINSIEGQRPEVRTRPPYPTQEGLFNKPTIVNNVETLAKVTKIMKKGSEWFLGLGTKESAGTKLMSISGDCRYPGVYEIEWGHSIYDILEMVGAEEVQAVQVGGPSGTLIGPNQMPRHLGYEDLGTGGALIIFHESRDLLKEVVMSYTEFFIEESCGSCSTCRNIPVLLKDKLQKILDGHGVVQDIDDLLDWSKPLKLSRCGLGHTAANPIVTSIQNFRHLYEKRVLRDRVFETGFNLADSVKESCEAAGRQSNI